MKSALLLITLLFLSACSDSGPNTTTPKASAHVVAQISNHKPLKFRTLPKIPAFVVLSVALRVPSTAAGELTGSTELTVIQDGKARTVFASPAEGNLLVDFDVDPAGRLITLTVQVKPFSFEIQRWADDLSRVVERQQVELPLPAFNDVPFIARFTWGGSLLKKLMGATLRCDERGVWVAIRNEDGALYLVSFDSQPTLRWQKTSLVEPAGGSLSVALQAGTTDVFNQLNSQYRPFITQGPDGSTLIAIQATRDMVETHEKQFGQPVEVSTPAGKDTEFEFGLLLSQFKPNLERSRSAFVKIAGDISSVGLFDPKFVDGSLYVPGYRRDIGTDRGFTGMIARLNFDRGLNAAPQWSYTAKPSVLRDLLIDKGRLVAVGSQGFTHNPVGLSIGPSMVPFWQVYPDPLRNVAHTVVSSINLEGTQSNPRKEYYAVLKRDQGYCALGSVGPYTHTADADARLYAENAFIECFSAADLGI